MFTNFVHEITSDFAIVRLKLEIFKTVNYPVVHRDLQSGLPVSFSEYGFLAYDFPGGDLARSDVVFHNFLDCSSCLNSSSLLGCQGCLKKIFIHKDLQFQIHVNCLEFFD